MPIERKRILKPFILLCEGRDAEGFLISYLNSDALTYDPRFSNEIQVWDFGGNDELVDCLINLKNMDGFGSVKSLAVIRDAEKDYHKACQEVIGSFIKSGFASPKQSNTWVSNTNLRVGFMLFPLDNNVGTLEDLCLRILYEVNGGRALSTIDDFLNKMESSHERVFPRKHKNKLHTYLSSHDKYVTMPLGLAAKAGAFNWDSDELEPLKSFLYEGLGISDHKKQK